MINSVSVRKFIITYDELVKDTSVLLKKPKYYQVSKVLAVRGREYEPFCAHQEQNLIHAARNLNTRALNNRANDDSLLHDSTAW